MEEYYKAVRRLEDKFDGLELNHVPRKYNEDADELAKNASGWTTVPPEHLRSRHHQALRRIQGSDGARPLVHRALLREHPADEVQPTDIDFGTSSADEAEAMEIDEAPTS